MRIAAVETLALRMAFIPDVRPHMERATTHGSDVTVVRVRLEEGTVGYGDAMGAPSDASAYVGRNALELLRGARHGAVQMACFDAVGKAAGLPAHALMGRQVRSRVPFAYWTIDLPPDTWARQVRHAAELGYTTYKFKCRPWWDPIEQVEAVAKAAPPGFRVWLDFNGHLREARQALPVLAELERHECVGGFESPIPQRDMAGYRRIREFIKKPIALHYGSGCCHVTSDGGYDRGVPGLTQIREDLCDGFVLGSADVESVRATAAVCAEARKPFWIQTVGTGLRAAWVAHLASTCSQGLLSHLAAHDLWARDILKQPLRPHEGWLAVPEGPGLGVEVDEDALRTLAVEAPAAPVRRISTVLSPSGARWHFADEQQRHEAYYFGHLPGFIRGVRLEVREDDGSGEFADLFARCRRAPVVE